MHIAFANGLDYLWGFLYANSMALACVWAARLSEAHVWRTCALMLAWLSWVVAILDVPENIAYYQMVRGVNRSPYPELLASCVATRTGIFLLFLAFLNFAVLLRVTRSNKPLQPTRAAQPNGQREPAGSGPRG